MWWLPAFAQETFDEEDIEVVVVSASRSPSAQGDHPVAVEVVTREEIEATGSESLAEVLEEQPGVQIERGVTGTGVRLQGLDPEHTLILIDGQRVLGRKDGVVDLSRIALDNVERIEIVKGPSSALYGSDAMGGVVHIITRAPEDAVEVGLHVRAGTLGRLDANADLHLGGDRFRHRAGFGWHAADAFDLDPSTPATNASGYQQGDVDYTMTAVPSDDSQVTAKVGYMQRRLRGIDSQPTGAIFDRFQIVEDARVSVNGWVTPTTRSKLTVQMSGAYYRDQFVNDQRGASALDTVSDNQERLSEGLVQVDLEVPRLAGTHFVSVGIDGLAQFLTSTRLADGKANRQRGAVFFQDTWSIGDDEGWAVQIAPGARFDSDTQFGSAFTPRLAMSVSKEAFTARVGAGTGFRAPDFRELYLLFENPGVGYIVAGQEDLRPERSRSVNGGLDWSQDAVRLSVSGFFNDVRDLIQVGTTDIEPGALQVFGYENVARARTAGGELQSGFDLDPLAFELGYAYTWSRDLDLERPLGGRVPHRVTGAITAALPEDVRFRVQSGYSSPRTQFADDQAASTPVETRPVFTTDARVSWSYEDFDVFAGMDNVFDSRGAALNPLVPRFAYVGFTARGRRP